ncbi:unnamed protein product [Closterium sp. Yama58-4]|nr:unnamed protein product [Closterium sp. Yama58-4]
MAHGCDSEGTSRRRVGGRVKRGGHSMWCADAFALAHRASRACHRTHTCYRCQQRESDWSAEEAVRQQLCALQRNDDPYPDHGVEVMYRFAGFDPFERSRYFGPRFDLGQFERFRRLFHHTHYRVLLSHKRHRLLSSFYVSPVPTHPSIHFSSSIHLPFPKLL